MNKPDPFDIDVDQRIGPFVGQVLANQPLEQQQGLVTLRHRVGSVEYMSCKYSGIGKGGRVLDVEFNGRPGDIRIHCS